MSRVIKFRGWNEEKMLEPQDLSQSAAHWRWLGKQDVVLMQFTGLLDKNGKEIYEGDVVAYDNGGENEEKYEVCWASNARFYLKHEHADMDAAMVRPNIEIIGNIYENPELLTSRP